jgi:hypothetical protein
MALGPFRWNQAYNNQSAFYDVLSANYRTSWQTDKQILQNPTGVNTAQALEAICRTLAEITELIETNQFSEAELQLAQLLYKK